MGQIRTSTRGFLAPAKYIQGYGEISKLENYTNSFGTKLLAYIDSFLFEALSSRLYSAYGTASIICEPFEGQVSIENSDKYIHTARSGNYDAIIGIGGGRTLDMTKLVANTLNLPLVIIPTSAATDAPTSALSVIYSPAGEHINEMFYDKGPDLVIVDTEIISSAPVRLLVAGMGDALATFFEARACKESDSQNNIKGEFKRTLASYAIAKECYSVLLQDGLKAKPDAEAGICSPSMENIIEVNTLLSGIGAESNGAAGAHAFHDGFTALEECKPYLHGERVAFGVLCQLVLENRDTNELEQVIRFSLSVGLPVTLREIGVAEPTEEKIRTAAKAVLQSPLILREPLDVTEDMLYHAIRSADLLGNHYRKRGHQYI
ncbi:glycerol dehydrogenase [Paenibacillus durus]|uniref:Glycerol dehydrogenase n=1 Tax=Paenibacillus durus ATCC 35681 TaxID=1333534 RepID=A0A0F7FD68_PAEDU|nr:glycerol dehydrogenase [Paenibacillus durus]AKG36332.1 glycerol dehydrogenase [Paenibacillus durus ATCC 35681]